MAAINSYRKDLVARPFPSTFLDENGEKDFDSLTELLTNCPPLHEVNRNPDKCEQNLLSLMRWVLNPRLYTVKKAEIEKVREVSSISLDDSTTPNFIFEVVHSKSRMHKFDSLKGSAKSMYAFHGSNLENFYSILNTGLKNNLNKTSLFGEGIYLSSDLSIVLHYSPMGKGWQNSIFGNSLSCVALCEMIDHPDVKCNVKLVCNDTDNAITGNDDCCPTHSKSYATSARKRSLIKGSEGGQIPEEYFVVRNDDLVRLKYLLVYNPNKGWDRSKRTSLGHFFMRHQFFIIMFLYALILLFASGICDLNWIKTFI